MQSKDWKTLAFSLAAVLTAVVLAQPVLAGDGVEETVRIKKIVKCEDGDCTETIENLGAGEGGAEQIKIKRVHCQGGEDCEEHAGAHKMIFVGEGGDVKVMAGDHGGKRGFLGVGLTELTPELREHFGVPAGTGVMVSKVMEGSPAFKAGVMVGDIIAGVDGEDVAGGSALSKAIGSRGDGEEVVLNVWRGGAVQSITAAVEERTSVAHMRHLDHMEQMGGMGKHMRKIVVKCDDGDEDCAANVDISGLGEFDCGSDECQVKVECNDGGCECSVNGEDADCSTIPGVPGE